jgi:hypothetical protein
MVLLTLDIEGGITMETAKKAPTSDKDAPHVEGVPPRKEPTRDENGRQVVTTTIQYTGNHLKLDQNIGFDKVPPRELVWRVELDNSQIDLQRLVTRVTLWFPDDIPMFNGGLTNGNQLSFLFDGSGNTRDKLLTINEECPTGTYPYAIFCDVDGGEDDDGSSRPVRDNGRHWEQRGRQMVDGGHSHPDCKVGL